MKFARFAVIVISFILTTSAVNAATQFKAKDASSITRICLEAANNGFDSAQKLFKAERLSRASSIKSILCNGLSVEDFAEQHYSETLVESKKAIVLQAADQSTASKFCVEAANKSESLARHNYHLQKTEIECNRLPVSQFISEVAESEKTVIDTVIASK